MVKSYICFAVLVWLRITCIQKRQVSAKKTLRNATWRIMQLTVVPKPHFYKKSPFSGVITLISLLINGYFRSLFAHFLSSLSIFPASPAPQGLWAPNPSMELAEPVLLGSSGRSCRQISVRDFKVSSDNGVFRWQYNYIYIYVYPIYIYIYVYMYYVCLYVWI